MDNKNLKVLMVAEKSSIARAVAESIGQKFQKRKGKADMCPVFFWEMSFFGKNAEINCTSVAGHIFSRDFDDKYQDWNKVDPIQLFSAETVKKEANPQLHIIDHLKQESQDCDVLVLWLDNDREGENICFEVINVCEAQMKQKKQILRAKFSSLAKEDLQKAFEKLKDGPNLNESLSIDARQIIDLKVGVAFTRFLTRYLMKRYENIKNSVISFGPCQTPTLSFCVDQCQSIKNYQPKKDYQVQAKLNLPTNHNQEMIISLSCDQNKTVTIIKEIEKVQTFKVSKIDIKNEVIEKPNGLCTVELLKLASTRLKMSPTDTMHLSEKLYLNGLITYPRTETTAYSKNFEFKFNLEKFPQLQDQATALKVNPANKGQDAGDHPPITLTSKPAQQLSKEETDLYLLIAQYYLASLSENAVYEHITVTFQGGKQSFIKQYYREKTKGFLIFMEWKAPQSDEYPNFTKGQEIPIKTVESIEVDIPGPSQLNEEQLIENMDKYKIGTDASMATHVNTICERAYVLVNKETRELGSTELGNAVIQGIRSIDPDLASPKLRSDIEKQINKIAQGKEKYEKVLQKTLQMFEDKFKKFSENIHKIDNSFDGVFKTTDQALNTAPLFSQCGRCKNQMRLLSGKIFCEKCKCMIGLPKKQNYERTNEFCKVDNYEYILIWGLNEKDKSKAKKICPPCNQKAFREGKQ